VPIEEALDVACYGGKTAALARAARAGLPVPAAIALSWEDVEAVASGQDAAARAAWRALGGGVVAVRSSAVDEDSAAASFAGQHATILGAASADEVARAVVEVSRSGQSDGALAYRRRAGLSTDCRIAVLVQRLVDPVCAGVMFTRDPVSGAAHIVIEASWGLGEVVVQGLVVPERWRVARDGSVLERDAGHKDVQIVRGEEEPVDPARARAFCLGDAEVAALVGLCRRLDAVYGDEGHDVEWAVRGDDLHLLQRRPITSRFGPASSPDRSR
jgi:pyruvate, water dikinase